jgi:cell division protease FtsH
LLALLESHKVKIDVQPPPTHWLASLLANGLPILLLVGLFVWMGRQAVRSQSGVFSFGRSKARRYTSDRPQVTFADVAGIEEAKADLQEEVEFLRNPANAHFSQDFLGNHADEDGYRLRGQCAAGSVPTLCPSPLQSR